MMSEVRDTADQPRPKERPFPWYCPRCRRKEVRRTVVRYQCPRTHEGRPLTVVIPDLEVPRCDACGELVFDYRAEEQLNEAFRRCVEQAKTANGDGHAPGLARDEASSSAPPLSPPR